MDKIRTGVSASEVEDAHHAPFVTFDDAATYGYTSGILCVTLSTARFLQVGEEVQIRPVVAAHLRCSRASARRLRDSLDKLLLMTEPQTTEN